MVCNNPDGILVGKRGICSGYTSTCQLFMDMLDIVCISVQGTVFDNLDEHGWNLVEPDGEWYGIDLCWNDVVGVDAVSRHWYFNVTSDLMRRIEHHWDESGVPEATGATYAWRPPCFPALMRND